MKKLIRYGLLFVALLLIALLALLYSAPGIGLAIASRWYAQQGEGYQLHALSWSFAPFKSRLTLDQVELVHPGVGTGKTELAELAFDLDLWAAREQQLHVRSLSIRGLNAALELTTDSLKVAGLTLPLATANNAAKEPEKVPQNVPAETADRTPGSAENQAWTIRVDSVVLDNDQLAWQVADKQLTSSGSVTLNKLQLSDFNSNDQQPLQVELQLTLNAFSLTQPQAITFNAPLTLQVQGQLLHLLSDPQWQGDVSLSGLDIGYQQQLQLALNSFSLRGIDAGAAHQQIAQLSLAGLSVSALPAAPQPLLTLASYDIAGIEHSASALTIGEQQFSGLSAALQRLADGSLQLPQLTQAQDKETVEQQPQAAEGVVAETGTGAKAAPQTMALLLSGLQQLAAAADQPLTRIDISDQSVTPPLQAQLTLYELTIGEIKPDLSGAQPALTQAVPLHMLLGLDDYNRIRVDGELSLFSRDGELYPQGSIKLSTEQLDLVPFNGYLNTAMGYQVERGMLDVNADIRLNKAQLGGEIKILLRNSRFIPTDEATINRVSKQISMPVDTALDLLRDDNGNVRLTVPLSGDLSNPDVGLSDLTNQLSKLALQQGALYYLKQTLQPYATMLTVATYAGEYLFSIRLDALNYQPGVAELSDEQKPRVEKVAQLMIKKTDLELRVCPFVSAQEAADAGDGWATLANNRARTIKSLLATFNDEKGRSLAPRVTLCKAQKGKKAEVVMGIE